MKISIIIPPVFSTPSLQKIIDSLSCQSYSHYELLVVGSPGLEPGKLVDLLPEYASKSRFIQVSGDNVNPAYQAFPDTNGDLIWIIDCLDEFDPDKLMLHVKFFAENPAIGGVRSGSVRKEAGNILHSLNVVAPAVDVADVILNGPVFFSDLILRREWVEKFLSGDFPLRSGTTSSLSLPFYVQILLAGCQIAGFNQMINLRSRPVDEYRDVKVSAESALSSLNELFENPRLAPSLKKWWEKSTAQVYLYWSIRAFAENETELGQRLFRSSILLNRSILDIGAFAYFSALIDYALQEREMIDGFIRKNINQLSPEFAWMAQYLDESIARGYFFQAVDETAFSRRIAADQAIKQASAYGLDLTEADLMKAVRMLSNHALVYGYDAMKIVVKDLSRWSRWVDPKKINRMRSTWFINQAFASYREGNYDAVPKKVFHALLGSPKYVFNPGTNAIFFKSLVNIFKRGFDRNTLGEQQNMANNFKGNADATKSKI